MTATGSGATMASTPLALRRGRRCAIAVGAEGADAAAIVRERRSMELIRVGNLREAAALIEAGLDGVAFLVVEARLAPSGGLLAVATAAAVASPGLALGVVRAHGAASLRKAAQRIPSEPSVAPAGGTQRLFVGADQPLSLRGARLAGGWPTFRSGVHARAELRAMAELCYLVGHANSMHVCLDGVVVCRRSAATVDPSELRVYPCFHGEPCHFGQDRGDCELSADDVRARRIISLACFGGDVSDVPFASDYSVGAGLLHHAGVEAAVTIFRAATVTSADLALLYYLTNSGLPLGTVANRVNAFRGSRGEPAELLCFGDPESRLHEVLDKVPCRRDGSQLTLDPGDSTGAARDLVAVLPPGPLPSQPVLVDHTAGDVRNAVLDPAGAVYVTIPEDWKAQPIRFDIVDRSELMDVSGAARALAQDMEFLDAYLPLIEEVNGASPELAETLGAAHRLKELLRAWPLSELPLYLRIEERQVEAVWRGVRRLVNDLGSRFVAMYRELMSRDHRTHPTAWDSRVITVATASATVPCAYCGEPMDEFQTRARLGRWRRKWGLCRTSCAYVFDGDPVLGRWIETPRRLEAGRTHSIAIATRNPYGIPLHACAIGVLKRFERGRSQPTAAESHGIAAGAPARVLLELRVPDDVITGTYHFSACLMIGTRINFYRAQVPVSGRTPNARLSACREETVS